MTTKKTAKTILFQSLHLNSIIKQINYESQTINYYITSSFCRRRRLSISRPTKIFGPVYVLIEHICVQCVIFSSIIFGIFFAIFSYLQTYNLLYTENRWLTKVTGYVNKIDDEFLLICVSVNLLTLILLGGN